MNLRRLPPDEAAVRRYVEDLWLPYNRELEAIVDEFALADDVDVVAEERGYRLGLLESEDYRLWIAVDGGNGGSDLADDDGEFVGFVATDIDEAPTVFDRPDRLVVCDIYVREHYRGTGVARELVERARRRARESGCDELRLDVDVENERAIAFYEKVGFEPSRHTMHTDVAGN
jgi:ribosomal protein S18 acetylase RimI-like enzyme